MIDIKGNREFTLEPSHERQSERRMNECQIITENECILFKPTSNKLAV